MNFTENKMSNSTTRKIKLNFIFSLLAQAVTLFVGIIVPRLFIINFGSEVNGYINSINQIFVYIALLEAGVGSAAVFSLYSPVGHGDKDKINGILSATHRFYRRTAWIYLGIIIVLSFVYPLLVKSSLSYPLMVGIFLISGCGGVVAYFFHAKYKLLLDVDGKSYVISVITSVYQIALSLGKAIFLLLGWHILLVQSLYVALSLVQAAVFGWYIKKSYPWLNLKARPDNASISKSKNAFVHQISGLIFNNTDVLILTFVCDLKVVSVYALYKTLVSLVGALITHFLNSINFKLGQTFEDKPKFLKMFDAFETFHITLTFSLCTVAYLFLLPFMRLYTNGMDANYLLTYMPLLAIASEILSYIRLPAQSVITFAGHFKETQWRSVAESVINLTTSLILVFVFEHYWGLGIYGVLLGTVLALLYRTNDILIYANKKILNRSPKKVYTTCVVCLIISVAFVAVFNMVDFKFANYLTLTIGAAITCITVIIVQFIANFAVDRASGKFVISLLKGKHLNK